MIAFEIDNSLNINIDYMKVLYSIEVVITPTNIDIFYIEMYCYIVIQLV